MTAVVLWPFHTGIPAGLVPGVTEGSGGSYGFVGSFRGMNLSPFQGFLFFNRGTQGVALGYHLSPPWG